MKIYSKWTWECGQQKFLWSTLDDLIVTVMTKRCRDVTRRVGTTKHLHQEIVTKRSKDHDRTSTVAGARVQCHSTSECRLHSSYSYSSYTIETQQRSIANWREVPTLEAPTNTSHVLFAKQDKTQVLVRGARIYANSSDYSDISGAVIRSKLLVTSRPELDRHQLYWIFEIFIVRWRLDNGEVWHDLVAMAATHRSISRQRLRKRVARARWVRVVHIVTTSGDLWSQKPTSSRVYMPATYVLHACMYGHDVVYVGFCIFLCPMSACPNTNKQVCREDEAQIFDLLLLKRHPTSFT